jgi:hypothetical protein
MEAEKKIYVGSGVEFGNYGDVNIDICLSDLPIEWIKKSEKNGKKYIKLTVSKKKAIDQYKKTHSVSVNTWKSNKQETNDMPF